MDKSLASRLRDLVKFLSSVQGDLANVTGPASLLAPCSVVEVGRCWAQRPAVFAAPAREPSPERRALLVLRLVLVALRSQLYIGCDGPGGGGGSATAAAATTTSTTTACLRKPLNAFLGELFLARWTDGAAQASTRLVAEQVSHHPPITAVHVADADNGVRADGYARVEMTFSGSVDVCQVGHAVLHVDRYGEDYLIPLPDAKVRGFLSGKLYPELTRTYSIVSSSGYVAEMQFHGAGVLWGKRNSFTARVYKKAAEAEGAGKSLYTVSGVWSDGWTVTDARTGEVVERYDVRAEESAPAEMELEPEERQDAWESRKAWRPVLDALERGDYRDTVAQKTRIEQAQRRMRADEAREGATWQPLFFRSIAESEHDVFHRLAEGTERNGRAWRLEDHRTKGVWRVDEGMLERAQRPFRGGLTPLGWENRMVM